MVEKMSEEQKKKEEKKDLSKVRSIFLSGMIDEKSSREVIEKLIQLEKESPLEDIYLYLDSYGGYLDSMFAIVDAMDMVKCDVQTICVGKAMSAGAVILSSGKRGKRFITPNARTMVHQLFALSYGTAAEIEKESQEIKRMQLQMERILAKNTRQPLKQIRKDLKDIKYMDAEGSVKYGLVDIVKK